MPMTDLQKIQDLFDRNLFLQAYGESTARWSESTDLKNLSTDELVLGGRLAARLGGLRVSRRLFRAAYARDPSNPRVKYYASRICRPGWHLIDDLRAFESNPNLDGNDLELQAGWFASYAVIWARLRDFAKAGECIERARSLVEQNSWVLSCESEVFGLADRWQDALKSVECAFKISPDAPYVLHILCDQLVSLGRLEEAAERAAIAAEKGESYEIAGLASYLLCGLAETLEGTERLGHLDRARRLAEKLPTLAPLADRETKSLFARTGLDIAQLLDDRKEMARWAEEIRSPYHRRVLKNLQKNPKGLRIRLPFRPVKQKHLTCLPASVSSVLAAMDVHVDADVMAADITYGGTPDWAAAEWLEKRGLVVRFFIADPEVAASLIKSGIPFVLSLATDEVSHAVAAVGLDEAAGTLLLHDPGQPRMREYLLKNIGQNEGPLGPSCMAAVPPDRAPLLDQLITGAHPEVAAASHRCQRAHAMNGPAAGRRIVDELARQQPVHPGTRCLQAIQARAEGRTGEALLAFQQLLSEFQNSSFVRKQLLWACQALGNAALMRKILADVVERGILPGVQSGQGWRYPPATYVCQYADQLRQSAASRKQARALLHSVIARQPACAEAWHVLGGLLWQEDDKDGALISYRLASCLESHNEHYGRSYQVALGAAGREEEGLTWLETRARRLGASPRAAEPWTSWIRALERFGHPERALAACHEALRNGSSPELLAFIIPFFARMGLWEESETSLRQLETGGHSSLYSQAAVGSYRMRGELDVAIGYCEEWSHSFPHDMLARRQWLDLIAKRDGVHVALDLARRWSAERPNHDQLEELYCAQMDGISAGWKKDLVLARRVKRNSEDGWAWRELTYRRLNDYEHAGTERRAKLHPRIERLLAQCDRVAPEVFATRRAHALWSELRGHLSDAVAGWLKAIEEEPGSFYSYQRIWDCSATFQDAERRNLFQQIEPMLLRCPGRLSFARHMVLLLAQRFGVAAAEEIVTRWKVRRPNDPNVIEAVADLLLQYGHGRSDTARALALLEPAVDRFPYYVGLRYSLAHARQNLGRDAEAEETLREIIRRHPDHTAAHLELARIHERRGDLGETLRLLERAADRDPLNPAVWRARAGILIRSGRASDARVVIQQGLQRMPEDVGWRNTAIKLLLDCGDREGATHAAREGVRLYPDRAFLWLLLAKTLAQAGGVTSQSEIESCLRLSLAHNIGLFDAADNLTMLLVEQHRYNEAEEAINRILPHMSDPSPARGRLAWIRRRCGRREEGIEEMAAAVSAAPWYLWGWKVLMRWLIEDQKWDMARRLLCPIPPEISSVTEFREKRLFVLANAGIAPEVLDAEWVNLLQDFPENVSLHLARYDLLRAHRRAREAASVLLAIRPVDPDSPYVLARLAEVLAEGDNRHEAIEAIRRIWFAEREPSAWAAEYAWKAAERLRFDNDVYQEALRYLVRGSRPTSHALSIMAAHCMDREFLGKKVRQPHWRTWLPSPGAREVLGLLAVVDRSAWANGHYRAVLFRHLCNFGYQRLVVRYWKRNPAAVEAHVDSWAELGRALVGLGRNKEARKVVGAWRERAGVPMWAVATYVSCFSRRKVPDLQEVLSTCTDALENLTHDTYAKYLAHVQAETCALLGDASAFRKTWQKHKGYFTGELDKSEWFEARRRHLLSDIPRLAEFLEGNRTEQFRKASQELRDKQYSPPPISTGGTDAVTGEMPRWLWWIIIWLALSAMANFFNQNVPR
jgi:tetratricopeptide (TPR) repeat protein